VEKYINPLREQGVTWGYDMQYLFTGLLNRHPKVAIDYTKAGRKDLTELYNEVILLD
jgi:4-hydroxy 2-oxovalerate aldolase